MSTAKMLAEVQLWRVGLPERTLVTLLFVLGLAGRLAGVLLYGDAELDMEWNTYASISGMARVNTQQGLRLNTLCLGLKIPYGPLS